jgi:xanthine dehydrogenase accessory factor
MELLNQKENLLKLALEWADQGRRVAIATVISTWGSASRPVGSQLIVDSSSCFEGSVSGGCVEPAVIIEALEVIKSGKPQKCSFSVSNEQAWDVGMTCGGSIEIYIESLDVKRTVLEKMIESADSLSPLFIIKDIETGEDLIVKPYEQESLNIISPELKDAIFETIKRETCACFEANGRKYYIHGVYPSAGIIIIGANDISRILGHMAMLSNFNIMIIDPRSAFARAERFPGMKVLVEWPDEALANFTIHERTAIVALSHDPKIDDPALKLALDSKAFYIGALGSRKTHAGRLERLRNEGFTEENLIRIHGPVGLDIGAKTHSEIAVAILAEIIKAHRKTLGDNIK